jgi:hypothetical protein
MDNTKRGRGGRGFQGDAQHSTPAPPPAAFTFTFIPRILNFLKATPSAQQFPRKKVKRRETKKMKLKSCNEARQEENVQKIGI